MSSDLKTLEQKRDELIAHRNALNLRRLNSLLSQKSKPPKVHTLETYKNSIDLIGKHSKVPLLEIDKRLDYAKLTCPWMIVENIKKVPNLDASESKLCFDLIFVDCCDLQVVIYIDNSKQSIQNLEIKVQRLYPIDEESIVRNLIDQATLTFDFSLFVYRMNTLLRMRHKRKRIWMNILDDINHDKLISINGYELTAKSRKDSMATILFDHSPSLVVFRTKNSVLSISWNIDFNSKNRHCVSEFTATSGNKNITKLFTALIKSKDLKLATLQLLNL